MTTCSKTLRELALAFPMEAWVLQFEEEAAAMLAQFGDAAFSATLRSAMFACVMHVQDNDGPPSADQISAIDSAMAKAVAGHHFLDDETQRGIADFLGTAAASDVSRCELKWSLFFVGAGNLAAFWTAPADHKHGLIVKTFNAIHDLKSKQENVTLEVDLAGDWKRHPAALHRSIAHAKTLLASKSTVTVDGTLLIDVDSQDVEAPTVKELENVINAGEQRYAEVTEAVRRLLVPKLDTVMQELTPIAGGDHEQKGQNWLGEKALDKWTDWTELKEHYKHSLKLVKGPALVASMKKAEQFCGQAEEFATFFSTTPLDLVGLKLQYSKAVVTKLHGCLMKVMVDLDKDLLKLENARTKVRAELNESMSKLSPKKAIPIDEHMKNLPKVLRTEVALAISMKRPRRVAL